MFTDKKKNKSYFASSAILLNYIKLSDTGFLKKKQTFIGYSIFE